MLIDLSQSCSIETELSMLIDRLRTVNADRMVIALQEDAARAEMGEAFPVMAGAHGHGVPQHRSQDSVYYHPQLNPTGTPPVGKPQRYRSTPQLEGGPSTAGKGNSGTFDHARTCMYTQETKHACTSTHIDLAQVLFCPPV